MNDQRNIPPKHPEPRRTEAAAADERGVSTGRMHENVPYWSDPVCPCEAEPYWQALKEEPETLDDEEGTDPC